MMKYLFTLIILLLPLNAVALDDTLLGIRLDWSQYDTTVSMASTDRETRIDHVALVLNEPSWKRFYGGLRLGYVGVSQPDNPDLAGFDLNGNSLGLRLGAFLIRNARIDLFIQGDIDYLYTDAEEGAQKAELDWTEVNLQIGARLKLGLFRFSAAGYRNNIDGEQTLHGDVNATTRFHQTEQTGVSAGVEFQVDPTGFIGIHTESGARDGTRLTFIREF
jgi:hypothetical protein